LTASVDIVVDDDEPVSPVALVAPCPEVVPSLVVGVDAGPVESSDVMPVDGVTVVTLVVSCEVPEASPQLAANNGTDTNIIRRA
jgi:hypothetical protein